MVGDISKRSKDGKKYLQKFYLKKNWIWEQDWCKPHSAKICDAWLEKNIPFHTPTLRSEMNAKYWFPAKMDDFWIIERVWGIMKQEVYAEPRPKNVYELVDRIKKAHSNLTTETLTKLVHEMPARMQEIYKMRCHKIHLSWDYDSSLFRCTCKFAVNHNLF